jgi:hypothetical protein
MYMYNDVLRYERKVQKCEINVSRFSTAATTCNISTMLLYTHLTKRKYRFGHASHLAMALLNGDLGVVRLWSVSHSFTDRYSTSKANRLSSCIVVAMLNKITESWQRHFTLRKRISQIMQIYVKLKHFCLAFSFLMKIKLRFCLPFLNIHYVFWFMCSGSSRYRMRSILGGWRLWNKACVVGKNQKACTPRFGSRPHTGMAMHTRTHKHAHTNTQALTISYTRLRSRIGVQHFTAL